ncbi:addiction module toxin RelE [Bacteroides sp.]|uniref:addiction module toxin RelE n=1 Tax=Bacteroides sp. TaxID=29523 RepID=UPI0023CACAA8|nr:addiction module toxin RelE [Bacteroides sp.]MDE5710167.1 type II toxin-antitoxin system RelE/ParE family toxin [Bacteroides sp.]MDE5760435.1 type II toxin-antitoxin system RelE/ParE family toxin [Bacteroides sp.]MDE6216242.1 type II toxin-antitoxin system RelE/ParE family toxin [Bacteroides sp.]
MITIVTLPQFDKNIKKLCKKYHSLYIDFAKLIQELQDNPYLGTDLGNGARKIRLSITSKGKRGGARVLTDTEAVISMKEGCIVLLSIYDKSEMETLSDTAIKALIKEARDL